MSTKPTIKWRDRDTQRLEKEIRNFNAKVYRSRKKYNNWGHLPRVITANDKREMVEKLQALPRNEFNKKVNALGRFSKVKGAEEPVKATSGNTVSKYEKRETGLKVAELNRARTRERKRILELPTTNQGKLTGQKRGEMADKRISELQPINYDFETKQGGREWDSFQRMLEKNLDPDIQDTRREQYKQNIITAMRNEHGEAGEDVAQILEKLPYDVIAEKYYTEEQATIDFVYDEEQREKVVAVMRKIWRDVADENKINWKENEVEVDG